MAVPIRYPKGVSVLTLESTPIIFPGNNSPNVKQSLNVESVHKSRTRNRVQSAYIYIYIYVLTMFGLNVDEIKNF